MKIRNTIGSVREECDFKIMIFKYLQIKMKIILLLTFGMRVVVFEFKY